ncbi:MAG: DedA family protein [Phycisphaerae bacterium]
MHDMVQWANQWVAQYGYLTIFVALMLGMLWVPFPEETFLTAIGAIIARKSSVQFLPAALVAFAGTTAGVTMMYLLGRWAGFAFVRRFGKLIRVTPVRLKKAHDWFDRHGKWTLTFGYWIPYVRHINALVAGASRIRYREFALFAYPGGLAWVFTFISLGYFGGEMLRDKWAYIEARLRPILLGLTGLAAAAIVVYILIRRRRRIGAATKAKKDE